MECPFNDTELQVFTVLFSMKQTPSSLLYGMVLLPWTSLQSSIRNILSGPHRAPPGWAGTGDHIDAEGLYMTPFVCENLDHSLMNTGGNDGKLRIDGINAKDEA